MNILNNCALPFVRNNKAVTFLYIETDNAIPSNSNCNPIKRVRVRARNYSLRHQCRQIGWLLQPNNSS